MLGVEDWRNSIDLHVARFCQTLSKICFNNWDLEVTEQFFHFFSNIRNWLDILVFSDEDKNSRRQVVTSTSTKLTLFEEKRAIHWQTRYLGLQQ